MHVFSSHHLPKTGITLLNNQRGLFIQNHLSSFAPLSLSLSSTSPWDNSFRAALFPLRTMSAADGPGGSQQDVLRCQCHCYLEPLYGMVERTQWRVSLGLGWMIFFSSAKWCDTSASHFVSRRWLWLLKTDYMGRASARGFWKFDQIRGSR
jgi:hypothetical protein